MKCIEYIQMAFTYFCFCCPAKLNIKAKNYLPNKIAWTANRDLIRANFRCNFKQAASGSQLFKWEGKNSQNNLIIRLKTDCYHAILNVAKQVSTFHDCTCQLGFDGQRQSFETGHRNLWFFSTSRGASKHKVLFKSFHKILFINNIQSSRRLFKTSTKHCLSTMFNLEHCREPSINLNLNCSKAARNSTLHLPDRDEFTSAKR